MYVCVVCVLAYAIWIFIGWWRVINCWTCWGNGWQSGKKNEFNIWYDPSCQVPPVFFLSCRLNLIYTMTDHVFAQKHCSFDVMSVWCVYVFDDENQCAPTMTHTIESSRQVNMDFICPYKCMVQFSNVDHGFRMEREKTVQRLGYIWAPIYFIQ